MGATKRPVPNRTAWTTFGSDSLRSKIDAAIKPLVGKYPAVGVAVSGGPDSAMLAVHAAQSARRCGLSMHVFHVHHGLQQIADTWRLHVHDLSQMLGVACHSFRVAVDHSAGDGIESAARTARYLALSKMAQQVGVSHLLLAHHQDDQAETVLLRLLRGAGPVGLGAMAPSTRREAIEYIRPWLDVARSRIIELAHEFHQTTGWKSVFDPTNTQDRYTRSAVRERLAPQLDARWPGWQAILARHARQSREVAQVLSEVAAVDLAQLDPSPDFSSFSLARWRELSEPRQALVLRHWLAVLGQRMPTDARLRELMRQLRGLHALGHDRQMAVKHADVTIRCIRGRVLLK